MALLHFSLRGHLAERRLHMFINGRLDFGDLAKATGDDADKQQVRRTAICRRFHAIESTNDILKDVCNQ